jgi:hypothetical protein
MIGRRFALTTVAIAGVLGFTVLPAFAITTWTDWTSATSGHPGSATGTLGGVVVTYAGDLDGAVTNGISPLFHPWSPNSSFIGGTVTASPSTVNDDLRLTGDFTGTNTITFASPVVNPVFAVWSLGQPGFVASFTFDQTPTFEAGGPNSDFGGVPLSVVGNVVSGNEANGVVQFTGTLSSITWTNTPENFYAFTVGTAGLEDLTPVPEPTTLLLVSTTAAGLGLARWRQRRKGQAAEL